MQIEQAFLQEIAQTCVQFWALSKQKPSALVLIVVFLTSKRIVLWWLLFNVIEYDWLLSLADGT